MDKDEIPHGEKMITFKVRFWTTGLTNKKMALDKGAVTTVTNRSRGIRDTQENHAFFHSIDEIPKALKECLRKNDIVLVRRKGKDEMTIVNLD